MKTLKDFGFGKRSIEDSIYFEVTEMVDGLLAREGDILIGTDFNAPIINILWQMVANSRFTPEDSEGMKMVDKVSTIFTVGMAVEQIPFIINKLFPSLTGFKAKTDAWKGITSYLRHIVKQHEADFDPDNPKDFIDVYLTEIYKQKDSQDYNIEDLLMCIFDFFVAGTETSSTTLKWIVLYLTIHQDVQERCK